MIHQGELISILIDGVPITFPKDPHSLSRSDMLRSTQAERNGRADAGNKKQLEYDKSEAAKSFKAIRDEATQSDKIKVTGTTYKNLTRL